MDEPAGETPGHAVERDDAQADGHVGLAGPLFAVAQLEARVSPRRSDPGEHPDQQSDGKEHREAGQRVGVAELRPEELDPEAAPFGVAEVLLDCLDANHQNAPTGEWRARS